MKKIVLVLTLLVTALSFSQKNNSSDIFWNNLLNLCGKAYEGKITNGGKAGDGFVGEKLVMHVISCDKNTIKIPFHVGDNHSRTWIFTKSKKGIITLKHDHRNADGSDDKVTMYGGIASNSGTANMQIFPADTYTKNLLDYAFSNIWFTTLNEKEFTYNLTRVGSDRNFSVSFDLLKSVDIPQNPWGWK